MMSLYEDPAGTSWAGWEFAEHKELGIEIPPVYATVRDYSAAEANATNAANPLAFAESPVFRKNPSGMFTNTILAVLLNELLAKGIPEFSLAAEKTVVVKLLRKLNMNVVFKPHNRIWRLRS